ncbi:AraC family transcriptional regulator [soil metagenome]
MVRAGVVERAPPDDLRGSVRCSYEATFDGERYDLIPDGCVDLLWRSDGSLVVYGPETAGWSFQVPEGSSTVGVRFELGVFPALLGIAAHEVLNLRIPLDEITARQIAQPTMDRLQSASSLGEQRSELVALSRALARGGREISDSTLAALALVNAPANSDTLQIARELGMSRRHVHRVCVRTLGCGPSMFRRVARVQRALRLMRSSKPKSLAQVPTRMVSPTSTRSSSGYPSPTAGGIG